MNVKTSLQPYEHAITEVCCNQGCKLITHDLPNTVILSMDSLSSDIRADCLIFSLNNDLIIGVCELKSKHLDVSKIQQQIHNSVTCALKIHKSCFPKTQYRVIPILLTKGYKGSVHHRLSHTKIMVCGKKHHIRLKKCGDMLSKII